MAIIALARNTVQILQDAPWETQLTDDNARTAKYATSNAPAGGTIAEEARMKMQNKRQCQARVKTNSQGVALPAVKSTLGTTCVRVVAITSP